MAWREGATTLKFYANSKAATKGRGQYIN